MMMLRALAVGVDETTLGFAENEDGSGPALGLQREAGARTYQLATEYATVEGGIEAWQLAEGWLKLRLSPAAASELGVHADLIIQFAPVHTDEVRAALARIMTLT